MRDTIETIGILSSTKRKIKKLAEEKKLSQITILEYLLNKKINIDEL
jgi:hypothetical protein